ncbi:MAG: hypothetical protein DWQ31_06640 [Planctomycetota bacterium]|nr:MAG: hypothetical protein DWQ31_06640 [Planctomycetota bacterium]REJ90347.1 MAG: hypothetical protein DWQ35_16865 [Planctomycetota bacterium]
MADQQRPSISFRFDREYVERLNDLAKQNGLDRGPQIEAIVRDYLDGKSAIHKGTAELERLNDAIKAIETLGKTIAHDLAKLRVNQNAHTATNQTELMKALAILQANIADTYGGLLASTPGQDPNQARKHVQDQIYRKRIT